MNDQHINEFISYSQSTHLTVVVNSIAMAVLKLMHNYQDTLINPATIDLITGEDYLQCVAVLSTLTPDDFCKEDEDPVLFKDLQQNLPSVIEYIVTKSKSPIHDEFDKVSIFNGTDDEIICFPLSKILVLTVKALYDHQKFTHQYTGTEEERLIAATKDLPLRLLSMFKCVKKINIDELYEKKRQLDVSKLELFKKILNRIHVRIKTTARQSIDEKFCWFVVPEVIIGIPKYDQAACIAYIMDTLKTNGFQIRYFHPNTIFISWNHWVPSYVRTEIKKKTGIIINEYGEKMKDENENEEDNNMEDPNIRNADIQQLKNSKKYTPINSYKPSGKLVYSEDLLSKIENKIN